MWVAISVAESVCLIFGSLLAAFLLCFALWRLLAIVRHPELGAIVVAAVAITVLFVPMTHSPFVRLMLLFAATGAVPLWIAGREWRAAEKAKLLGHGKLEG